MDHKVIAFSSSSSNHNSRAKSACNNPLSSNDSTENKPEY